MRSPGLPLAIPLVAVLLAACGTGSGASPVTATPDVANPTPVIANPTPVIASPATSSDPYWLRLSTFQAIPPLNLFGNLEQGGDHRRRDLCRPRVPSTAIYPRPAGHAAHRASAQRRTARRPSWQWAGNLGLPGPAGRTSWGDGGLAGGITRVRSTSPWKVDGSRFTRAAIRRMRPGIPRPAARRRSASSGAGSPACRRRSPASSAPRERTSSRLTRSWWGSTADPRRPGQLQQIMDWPLDTPLATLGAPWRTGHARCGDGGGFDTGRARPSIEQANQLTQWVQDPSTSATFGLTVRPLVPGEDRCREIFGPG